MEHASGLSCEAAMSTRLSILWRDVIADAPSLWALNDRWIDLLIV